MDKNTVFGILVGVMFSLIGLMVVSIIYKMSGRAPEAVEISLAVWATTIISMFSGVAVASLAIKA